MREELSLPIGIVAPKTHGKTPWWDMSLEKPQFATFDSAVAVTNLGFTFSEALYFGATENKAAFEGSKDFVIVAGSAIGRHDTVAVAASSSSRPLCLFTLCSSHLSSVPRGSDGITRG